MKSVIIFLYLFFGFALIPRLKAQTSLVVSGTVKSLLGTVQGAQIEFFDLNNKFLSNATSGTNGNFKSESRISVSKTIKIKISEDGYDTIFREVKIDKGGYVGEFILTVKKLIISGFVKDSISEQALPAVQTSFYNREGKLIEARLTDAKGFFTFETDFVYGQKITVRQSKKDYYDKEQTLTFSSDGLNRLTDVMLPQIADRGLRAYIQVKDKKTDKLLGGGVVSYLEKKKSTYVDTIFSANKKLELKIYQRPGTILDLEINKPNYISFHAQPILSEDPLGNSLVYTMEKDRQPVLGAILLISSGSTAVLSGGMYLSSKKKYDSYKNFGNANRESDYNSAQKTLNVAAVAGCLATGALIGYVITKISHANRIKALDRKLNKNTAIRLSAESQFYVFGTPMAGVAYHF